MPWPLVPAHCGVLLGRLSPFVCGIAAQVVWTTMSGRWPALPVVGLPWSGVVGGVGSTAAPLVLDGAPAVDAVWWWGGVCVCVHMYPN